MVDYLDFFIPKEYRGKEVKLPRRERDPDKGDIYLQIPLNACYLDVNPLEDEEEFQGDQGASDRQQILYYTENPEYISTQDLEHKIVTEKLMTRLELIFKKHY